LIEHKRRKHGVSAGYAYVGGQQGTGRRDSPIIQSQDIEEGEIVNWTVVEDRGQSQENKGGYEFFEGLSDLEIPTGIDIMKYEVEFSEGWDAINDIRAWDCMLSECNMLEYVPRQHIDTWVWVNGEILRKIRGVEGR